MRIKVSEKTTTATTFIRSHPMVVGMTGPIARTDTKVYHIQIDFKNISFRVVMNQGTYAH